MGSEQPKAIVILLLFFLGWLMIYADRTVLYPLISVVKEEWNLTFSQSGLILSTYAALYVALQVPAGLLGDRYGLRKALWIGYLLGGFTLLLAGMFARTFNLLLLLIALHGLGVGFFVPTAYAMAMRSLPETFRGTSSALMSSGVSVGSIVGLTAAAPLFLYFHDWRPPLIVVAIPTIVLALLYRLALKEIRGARIRPGRYWGIMADRDFLLLNIARFCIAYGHWTIIVWGPTYLLKEKSIPFQLIGVLTSAYAMSSIPSAILLGKLSDSFGRRNVSILVSMLFALASLSVVQAQGWQMIVAALIFCGAVSSISIYPVMLSWAADIIERRGGATAMGTAMGVFNLSGVISGTITPVLTGSLADLTGGLRGGFELTAALAFAGGILTVFAKDVRKRNR